MYYNNIIFISVFIRIWFWNKLNEVEMSVLVTPVKIIHWLKKKKINNVSILLYWFNEVSYVAENFYLP